MIGRIIRGGSSCGISLSEDELRWFGIISNEFISTEYVQVAILGINGKPYSKSIPLFTQLHGLFLWIPDDFMEAYGLKVNDILKFHVKLAKEHADGGEHVNV